MARILSDKRFQQLVLADHKKPTNAQNMQRADPEHGVRKHLIQEKHATAQS